MQPFGVRKLMHFASETSKHAKLTFFEPLNQQSINLGIKTRDRETLE
jgi:hypothetical protein